MRPKSDRSNLDCDLMNTVFRSMRRFHETFIIGAYTILPQIMHVNRLTGEKRRSGVHAHRTFEFSLVLSGGITYHVNGADAVCIPGDAVIIPADMRHGWSVTGNDAVVFNFMLFISRRGQTDGRRTDMFRAHAVRRRFSLGHRPALTAIAKRIISAAASDIPYLDKTLLGLSREAYLELFKTLIPERTPPVDSGGRTNPRNDDVRNIIEAIRFYISDNLHRHIRPIEISRYLGLSLNRLNTMLGEHEKLSLGKMVIDRKLAFACTMLSDTNQQINEIARSIGMNDIGYFCRIFRKKKGISPSEYRMKNRTTGV